VRQRAEVWITGLGVATPLGNSYRELADALLAGRSGVRTVTSFDVANHPSRIAGVLDEIPCPAGCDPGELAGTHRLERLLLGCCAAALQDAGWWDRRDRIRLGLVAGVGAEWLLVWEWASLGGRPPAEGALPVTAAVGRRLQLSGPAVTVSAACASGNVALAQARQWLELGWVDVCLAGGCDAGVTPLALAGFGNLRALSRRNEDPCGASRPFARGRDGFVMAEGGAMFVLEPAASARRRSARAYGRLAGCGAASDAYNMVIPSPHPEPAVTAMRRALADAGVEPQAVDYINAHATGTPVGDVAEARVLATVFGEAVQAIPVSSTKSMTGHLLTGAAAVEAVACLAALERQALPPTINLHDPDPECPLCHVANEARPGKVRVTVSNSFGFGGSNTCLVVTAV
jgi:3-oxoacyl-[acyl-carrier-protein] synthase II